MAGMTVKIVGMDGAVLKFSRFNSSTCTKVRETVLKHTLRIEANAKQIVPVKTGALMRSIDHVIYNDGFSGQIGSNKSYAAMVELGTAPHIIYPKNGKVLVFEIDGEKIFTRYVNHPGTKPNAYLFPALELDREPFMKDIEDAVGKAAEENKI